MIFKSKKAVYNFYTDAGVMKFKDFLYETEKPEEIEVLKRNGFEIVKEDNKKEKSRSDLYKEAVEKGWEEPWKTSTKRDLKEFLSKQGE